MGLSSLDGKKNIFIMRSLFSFVGRKLYKKEYDYLKIRLIQEYEKINIDPVFKMELSRFLISAEDHRFRLHFGFDILAMVRALIKSFLFGKLEGASTIEQQLVRVLTNNYQLTIKRKIKEVFLSTILSEIVPRSEIPIIYLNIAYYGHDMIGLDNAIEKLQSRCNVNDYYQLAAELVARIKYPQSKNDTFNNVIKIEYRIGHLKSLIKKHKNYWYIVWLK
jgi:membrane carboxypeptidase/penicillin-binding protein PbpC